MISVQNLRKEFGQFVAVDDLSFDVEPGEVLGFLGPNGAGKSTTMKMITGFLTPSRGSVSVCGFDMISQSEVGKPLIGYLPEGAPLYQDMTVAKFLEFIADVRGFKGQAKQDQIAKVVSDLELESVLTKTIATLSKGFTRRVGLAQAIIHEPKVLILDEPTDGLDPNQKHQIRKLIKNLASDKIVIISTHILEEVTALCTRAMIIANGKMVIDEKPAELEARSKYHHAVTLRFDGEVNSAKEEFERLEQVELVEILDSGELLIFPKANQTIYGPVNQLIQSKGWEVDTLHVERGRLDDVFRSLTRGNVEDVSKVSAENSQEDLEAAL